MNLCACSIVKEEALYIREWLEFNRMMGFDKHYIYNNDSTDNTLEILQPYIEEGFVELIEPHFDPPIHFAAYQRCIDQHLGEDMWMAFIDVDEFLWSPRFNTTKEALDSLPAHWGAVGVNWLIFNGSGKEEWQDIPVIERFTWRMENQFPTNRHIKSVIKMNQYVHVGGDPHYFHVEKGTFDDSGELMGGPFTSAVRVETLRMNHYYTKSHQECDLRARKGRADMVEVYDLNRWNNVPQTPDVVDTEIQKYLPELKRRLGI
jgi:hypothetical protein